LAILDSGANTYAERQTSVNVAEFLFEYYCAEKEYKLTRIGFDEKNKNVDNFFKLNPFIRNLPDYIVNTPKGTYIVNVKGTGNLKQKEMDMLPKFLEYYSTKETPLIYAFCFTGKDPILVYPERLIELYKRSEDKQWPDGVIYRNLGL